MKHAFVPDVPFPITIETDGGFEHNITLPGKRELCSGCKGVKTRLSRSIAEHAYSSEEFLDSFPEPEDQEQYFKRGGIYDVQCWDCQGEGIVVVLDTDQMKDVPIHRLGKLCTGKSRAKIMGRITSAERVRRQCDEDSSAEQRMLAMMGRGEY
jgi:hypothetical protein